MEPKPNDLFDGCRELKTAVYEAVGCASTLFMNDDGVFDDELACRIAESLLNYFETYAIKRVGMCWDAE